MFNFSVTTAAFQLGLAEGVDPRLTPLGTLITAENVCWKKSGRLEKRYGTSVLPRTGTAGNTLSAARRIFTRGDELSVIDGDNLWIYSPAAQKWRQASQVPNLGVTWSMLIDPSTGVAAVDSAIVSSKYRVHAWTTGAPDAAATNCALYVEVIDHASGSTIIAPTLLLSSGASGVRVVVIGSKAYVVTVSGSDVYAYTVDPIALTVSSLTHLRADAAAPVWDATAVGSTLVLAYQSMSASISLYAYDATLTQTATDVVTGETHAPNHIGLAGASSEPLYVLYDTSASGNPVRMALANSSTLAQTVAPFTIEAIGATSATRLGVCRYSSSGCVAVYTANRVTPTARTAVNTTSYFVSSVGVVDSTSQRVTGAVEVTSKPFMFAARCYMAVSDRIATAEGGVANGTVGLNNSIVEVEVSNKAGVSGIPHRYLAKVEPLLGCYGATNGGPLPQAMLLSSTTALLSVPFLGVAPTAFANFRCGVRLVSLTLGTDQPADLWRTLVFGPEAYVSGGVLSASDGYALFDYGFPRAPYVVSREVTSTTLGHMSRGSYLYGGHLEYRSLAGVLHRSSTIQIAGLTLIDVADTDQVTIEYSGCSLGNKQSLARGFGATSVAPTLLVVSRNAGNSVGGGSPGTTLYRLTYEPGYNVVPVDQTALTEDFVDTRNDSAIDGGSHSITIQPALYTEGGILDDVQPPAFTTMALYQQRLWGIDGSQKQMWFSKSFFDDQGVAPGFSTSFLAQFEVAVTALSTMDEKLVAFAADRLWYFVVDGPSPEGTGGQVQGPVVIQSDVGCTQPRSVVSMPDGIMFASRLGLYLLTRGLELVWIGRPVQDTLDAYPTVTSAVLVANRGEIRFTCTTTDGSAGIVLAYNYVEKQWSTARYTVNGVYGAPLADACMWQGLWTAVSPNGFVLQENPATCLDGGTTWVPITIETAWYNAGGPVAYQSVRRFTLSGISASNHDLAIAVGFNGEATYSQAPVTWVAGSPVTAIGPALDAGVTIGTRRKCQAIRFKVTDATPTNPGTYPVGTGQGPSFTSMGLEVGVVPGSTRKLPATQRG